MWVRSTNYLDIGGKKVMKKIYKKITNICNVVFFITSHCSSYLTSAYLILTSS